MLATPAVLILLFTGGFAVSRAPGRASDEPPAVTTVTVEGGYHGVPARVIHHKLVAMRHIAYQRKLYAHRLHKTLLARPSVTEALDLAGAVYGNRDTLWRRARCESKLNPNARNGSEASGLLQFLPSTWRSTPFARFNIFSPYANALAAGWMIGPAGRSGEWVCR